MTGIERLEFLADVLADNEKYGAVAANLREIAAQITAELTDREGYESDVLAWAEEHGGLGRVSAAHERQKRHIDRVERWSAARAGRLKRHIATLEQALTRRNRRIRELEAQRDKSDLTHRAPVLASDGEPLEVGQTVYVIANGKTHHVTEVDAVSKRFRSMEQVDGSHWLDPMCFTYQRPVLAADGKPLREGETVYHIADGKEYTVEELFEDGAMVTPDGITGGRCRAEYLTHHRPVIAADGKPLREGETVWDTNGDELIIGALEDGGHTVSCRYADVGDAIPVHGMWSPSNLTHTKPDPTDTYSKLYEDVHDERCSSEEFVLRCRALAERGE